AVLAEESLTCNGVQVSVDARDYDRPPGVTGYVVATVTCVVPYDQLVPGLAGTRTITAQFRSPIDRYGARP
ncbi:MAG: hypothetical protein ACRDZY_19655, partial [Acidimicrobiales bacterium]